MRHLSTLVKTKYMQQRKTPKTKTGSSQIDAFHPHSLRRIEYLRAEKMMAEEVAQKIGLKNQATTMGTRPLKGGNELGSGTYHKTPPEPA